MIATIFGLILIAVPFLLVFCFKDRFLGFTYILGAVIVTHLTIAFVTQFFHIFLYPVIIIIHSIIALGVLAIIKYKFSKISFKFKVNWWVLLSFLIIFFQLWSVHFLYSGVVNTVINRQQVFASTYPYPYFSDEWVGVSLSSYSIDNNALPINNPLALNFKTNNFPNIFVGFFSLLAEIFLLLNLVPLFGYVYLSIAFSLIICLLIFILLRSYKVNYFVTVIAVLLMPYIVNGANLPGLWYLIPFTGGTVLFLISLISFNFGKNIFALLMGFISLFLYPPLVVFVLPMFVAFLLSNKDFKNKTKLKIMLAGVSLVLLIVILIIYSQDKSTKVLIQMAVSSIWRLNLDGGIPSFYPWNVLPIFIFPFSLLGLIKVFKNKQIVFLTTLMIGFGLWFFYSFSEHFLFIDYARLVVISSFFLLILFGFGLEDVLEIVVSKYSLLLHPKFIFIFKIFIVCCFGLLAIIYTNRSNWENLKLKVSGQDNYYVAPAPPANHYLTDDDLRLFSGITKSRFLSVPWKGLVIGVATNNYPMSSKQSIISNSFLNYNEFMSKSCLEKDKIAKKMKLDYVYSQGFSCKKFMEIGVSNEGFYLYKFTY